MIRLIFLTVFFVIFMSAFIYWYGAFTIILIFMLVQHGHREEYIKWDKKNNGCI